MIPSDISKSELMLLIGEYDRYIQEANDEDRYSEGWYPVCIDEFYDWEFQDILEHLKSQDVE